MQKEVRFHTGIAEHSNKKSKTKVIFENRTKEKIAMKAFHGNTELKASLLVEVEKHRLADQIISGTYGDHDAAGKWRGCAVGCSIQSFNNLNGTSHSTSSHASFPDLFGIPRILARLEDRLFEGMPEDMRAAWPGRFFNAIQPGTNLESVWPKFAIWLLTDATHGVIRHATSEKTKSAIERVAELYRDNGKKEEFKEAARNARADAAAYAYAAAYAAAYADAYADADARQKAFSVQAEKLLESLAEAE